MRPAQAFRGACWLAISLIAFVLTRVAGVSAAPVPTADQLEFFETKIRPLLVERCYECHSQGSNKVKGGLLLDTADGVIKGGETGPAIIPGDPDKSRLIVSVRYTDETLQMPPKAKLAGDQIDALVAWVKMGAPDPRTDQGNTAQAPSPAVARDETRRTWAFRPPVRPALPTVKNQQWVQSPVDAFILAKLEEKGLTPAAPADKRTLIRRATFDLIGLPPKPEEVEDFLRDDSADAFAKVVERLLAAAQYGERWGRHWLDVVRYADSLDARFRPGALGAGPDITEAYRYRDWVVDSFNRDLSYDRFIQLQIAGDILASRDANRFEPEGLVATSLLTIGRWEQGCSDKEKMLTDVVDEQIDVTCRAFLGLTVACARCHDHKFDPISTEDYYGLAGIFFSSHVLPEPGPKGGDSLRLRVPLLPPAEVARRQQREARLAELEKEVKRVTDASTAELGKSSLAQTAQYLEAVWEIMEGNSKGAVGEIAQNHGLREAVLKQWLRYLDDTEMHLFSRLTKDYQGQIGLHAWQGNKDLPWLLVNTGNEPVAFGTVRLPPGSVALHPTGTEVASVAWKSPIRGAVEVQGLAEDADPNCGNGFRWILNHRSGGRTIELAAGTVANGGKQSFAGSGSAARLPAVSVHAGDLVELIISPNRDHACDSTTVQFEIAERDGEGRRWVLTKEILSELKRERARNPQPDLYGHNDVWYFYDSANQENTTDRFADSILAKWFDAVDRAKAGQTDGNEIRRAAEEVQQALESWHAEVQQPAQEPGADLQLSKFPARKLYEDLMKPGGSFWTGLARESELFPSEAWRELNGYERELAALKANVPPPAPEVHAIQEGGVPKSQYEGIKDAQIHIRGRYDRLGRTVPRQFPVILAGEKQAPIQEGSGRRQLAEWLSSPENPLAARVMVNRLWQYHFGEGIVRTPSNFGKLGVAPSHPELLDYLAHRFIQSGWSIKAMHKLLMLSSVYMQSSHPQAATSRVDPDNTLFGWRHRKRLEAEEFRDSLLAAAGTLNGRVGGPATRDMLSSRRTLYLMTIRSDRNDYRALFDAADPSALTDQRTDSTVAPQALFLLNDPFVYEQVECLARRVRGARCNDEAERIAWLYERLFARPPSKEERQIGKNVLEAFRVSSSFSADEREKRAWQRFCHILLCSNEFMYVD